MPQQDARTRRRRRWSGRQGVEAMVPMSVAWTGSRTRMSSSTRGETDEPPVLGTVHTGIHAPTPYPRASPPPRDAARYWTRWPPSSSASRARPDRPHVECRRTRPEARPRRPNRWIPRSPPGRAAARRGRRRRGGESVGRGGRSCRPRRPGAMTSAPTTGREGRRDAVERRGARRASAVLIAAQLRVRVRRRWCRREQDGRSRCRRRTHGGDDAPVCPRCRRPTSSMSQPRTSRWRCGVEHHLEQQVAEFLAQRDSRSVGPDGFQRLVGLLQQVLRQRPVGLPGIPEHFPAGSWSMTDTRSVRRSPVTGRAAPRRASRAGRRRQGPRSVRFPASHTMGGRHLDVDGTGHVLTAATNAACWAC